MVEPPGHHESGAGPTLRLLADDLTGALDTAAELVPLTGPIETFWAGGLPATLPPSAAIDIGTRERDASAARAAVIAATTGMREAAIAFKKLDSLIRGNTLLEVAECARAGGWRHVIVAPAFPFQGRITRGGQQFAATGGGWTPAGPELAAALTGLGMRVSRFQPGRALRPGVTVFDAATDADLAAVVAVVHGVDDVLWCGTGGLAQALASGRPQPVMPAIAAPVLGLFGSDQAATAAQLAACAPHWMTPSRGGAEVARRVRAGLDRDGIALISLDLPDLARAEAADRIGAELAGLTEHLPPPATLVVAGGETLRAICIGLGARSLSVRGRLLPGVPVSVLRGGRWDGVTVLSKSGAFGPPSLWRGLLPFPAQRRLERITP